MSSDKHHQQKAGSSTTRQEEQQQDQERVPLLSSSTTTGHHVRHGSWPLYTNPPTSSTNPNNNQNTTLVEVDLPLATGEPEAGHSNTAGSTGATATRRKTTTATTATSGIDAMGQDLWGTYSSQTAAAKGLVLVVGDVEQTTAQTSSDPPNEPPVLFHQLLFRHDSEFSVGSDYQAPSSTWGRQHQQPKPQPKPFLPTTATTTPANTIGSLYQPQQQPHPSQPPETTSSTEPMSSSSSSSSSPLPLMSTWQGALLLTADCLGTGLLALPGDVRVSLGVTLGLAFLILNAPINWYSGWLLAQAATVVERRQAAANRIFAKAARQLEHQQHQQSGDTTTNTTDSVGSTSALDAWRTLQQHSVGSTAGNSPSGTTKSLVLVTIEHNRHSQSRVSQSSPTEPPTAVQEHNHHHHHAQLHHDTATFDFIGMTQALFRQRHLTRLVMSLYYCNIFLVLGNYILVMSHAVMATVGEGVLCTPVAGLIASVFMYAVSQSRSMARLGRAASFLSLGALFVVICQCLYATRQNSLEFVQDDTQETKAEDTTTTTIPETPIAWWSTNNDATPNTTTTTTIPPFHRMTSTTTTTEPPTGPTIHDVFRQLAALGSIGFAMGSQKLFLNIRHELADRSTAPTVLGISLCIFTAVYVTIILLAGPNPPAFLFDAIQGYWNRRIAGLLLWGHVVVSYAINSQAICSSMDRLFWHDLWRSGSCTAGMTPERQATWRWMTLTALMAVTAYTVANAIPFFQDLVALIGAVTVVPLTLLLPALYWRKELQVPLWWHSWSTGWSWPWSKRDSVQSSSSSKRDGLSYALVMYSIVFMVTATAGVVDSISQDWSSRGTKPFECSMT